MNRSLDNSRARCPASGSLRKALYRAVDIVCREFKITGDYPITGVDCLTIREEWCKRVSEMKHSRYFKERTRYRLSATLKSCNRLFDDKCRVCDIKLAQQAREKWIAKATLEVDHEVGSATNWSTNPIETLKTAVRELVGSSWGERIQRKGEMYVPDQQGCLETTRARGGSMSTGLLSRPPINRVRLGVAKTKGKCRVVTMQSAYVKRILDPIHSALYDHLTSFGWCVRGDVQKSDFISILKDRRSGENFISGDYESATDNIYSSTVLAIVDVLCESQHLTEEERYVLKSSFQDIICQMGPCPWSTTVDIKRGSMMGNLVSFPVLCLLNKACYDISRDIEGGRLRGTKDRRVRINGDDIVFAGSTEFYRLWRSVVSHYGLVVNEEKTGVSLRFLELNSRQFDAHCHRFVGKPVLSFLRHGNNYGDLLSEVVKGTTALSNDVQMYIINTIMRYEISVRPITHGNIPPSLWRSLIKRKWFRGAIELGPLPCVKIGVERCVPSIVAPPPRPAFYNWIDRAKRDVDLDFLRETVGRLLPLRRRPLKIVLDRDKSLERKTLLKGFKSESFYSLSPARWAFVWPAEIYKFLGEKYSDIIATPEDCETEWYEDHPLLTVRKELVKSPGFRHGLHSFRAVHLPLSLMSDTRIGDSLYFPT